MVYQGTRFFVLQDPENYGFGFRTLESEEINPEDDLSPAVKKRIVESVCEFGFESRFAII